MTPATGHIQCAFLDLDGTLLKPDQTISGRVRDSVERLRRRIPVSIATGRELLEAIRFAVQLKLTAPQICDGGAAIFEMPEGQVLWSLPLGEETSGGLLAELQSTGTRFFATHPEGAFTNLLTEDLSDMPWVTADPARVQGTRFTRICAMDLSMEASAAVAAALGSRFGLHTARAYMPYNDLWAVDFTRHGADKGAAAAMTADMAGVGLGGAVAIGDSYNDLPMMQACGLAIAMDGAPDEVLSAARHVVPSVEEDGLSVAIDEIVIPLL